MTTTLNHFPQCLLSPDLISGKDEGLEKNLKLAVPIVYRAVRHQRPTENCSSHICKI